MSDRSPGSRLLRWWSVCARIPGGRWFFALALRRMVPYTGSISPRVERLEPGFARVSIRQRRRIEQHLGSIHAIALANLAEFAGGAAMTTALPPGARGIVTRFAMEYFRKARGVVTAESRVSLPSLESLSQSRDHEVVADLTDEAGVMVARAKVRWRIGQRSDGRE